MNYGGRNESMTEGETVEAFNAGEFDRLTTDFLIQGLQGFRDAGHLDESDYDIHDKLVRELTERGVNVSAI
jgi:hypothetical protein